MHFFRSFFLFILILGLNYPSIGHTQDLESTILVSHAWIRAMPPSMKNTAAYLTIENKTKTELVLQSVTTTASKIVEIHQMAMDGDMMKMKMVDALHIPTGGRLELSPNGFHLMIIDLHRPLVEGETLPLVLNFKDGTTLTVNAVVRKWSE
ncbi:copper chaperone PCu(A)C [Geopsychrobacter electrodiphilus]|uniref:copper chaperone PCu(A)C n=1 Tax=Geopsychrobacter electrodiphilus TaxID=225196 RepID=UPI000371DFAF|nr:copper chaperone PCu(A)C [Geopsychrobacter electrodiphilus]